MADMEMSLSVLARLYPIRAQVNIYKLYSIAPEYVQDQDSLRQGWIPVSHLSRVYVVNY
jgi:hypothetical protein